MPTDSTAGDWITVEEATDERLAVERRLREEGLPVRLIAADRSDPSRHHGDLTVQVPLESFELALEVLEGLDEEGL